jgi:uncharacterized protein YceK
MKIVILLLGFVLFSGCSSINSIENRCNYPPYEKKVYAGTRNDLSGICCLVSAEPAWGVLALGELPFCLVADTLFLPYTIYYDYCKEDKINEERPPNQKDVLNPPSSGK